MCIAYAYIHTYIRYTCITHIHVMCTRVMSVHRRRRAPRIFGASGPDPCLLSLTADLLGDRRRSPPAAQSRGSRGEAT